MYGHTVEKSQLKGYNYNTLYTIGGIKMDRITQSMLDAFQNDFRLSFNDSALLFEYFSNYCVVNNIYGTNDFDLDEITKATNSQTAIKKEQLEALSTFQKNLEEFYKSFTTQESLVYERRTGQYRNSDIPQNRIISISTQIKTIAAMFLDEPRAVSGQYGAVVKRFGNKIFKSSDKPIIYYTSALALYKIENLFK